MKEIDLFQIKPRRRTELLDLWDPSSWSHSDFTRLRFVFYDSSRMRNKLRRPYSLNDDTQQYGKFRELAKKLFTAPKKAGDDKVEEMKDKHQKK